MKKSRYSEEQVAHPRRCGLSQRWACALLSVARSALHYRSNAMHRRWRRRSSCRRSTRVTVSAHSDLSGEAGTRDERGPDL